MQYLTGKEYGLIYSNGNEATGRNIGRFSKRKLCEKLRVKCVCVKRKNIHYQDFRMERQKKN